MKKHIIISGISSVAALLLAGCATGNKGPEQTPVTGERIDVTISTAQTRVGMEAGTDGDATTYTPKWEMGDKLAVFTSGAATNSNEEFSVLDIDGGGVAGSFSGAITANPAGGDYTFYALHPWSGEDAANTNIKACKASIPVEQSPRASTVDTKAYLSVSSPVVKNIQAGATSAEVTGFAFKRLAAPMVINIALDAAALDAIAAPEDEKVEKVTLTVDDSEYILAGEVTVDLENGTLGGFTSRSNSVSAVYGDDSGVTLGNLSVWLMVKPGFVEAEKKLTVNVFTDKYSFSREVTVPEGGIAFGTETVARLDVSVQKSEWDNVTTEMNTDGVSLPDHMTVLRNTNLHGRAGNTGYVVKIPAGSVDMYTSYKVKKTNTWYDDIQYMSNIVTDNENYNIFVAGIATIYYKPIVRNLVINDGALAKDDDGVDAVPWRHWNYKYYSCPPVLGVKNGKASIAYGDIQSGKLYQYNPPQNGLGTGTDYTTQPVFDGGTLWDVDAAVSGYAMPLKNGVVQISDESAADYKALADLERNFVFSTVNGMELSNHTIVLAGAASATKPKVHIADAERMARTMMGVTADGDLMVFVSERYTDNTNVLKTAGDPSDGSTLQEAATVLKELGCTNAMALHHIQHAVVAMQDGAIGKDLTRTEQRTGKAAGADLLNGTILMFK